MSAHRLKNAISPIGVQCVLGDDSSRGLQGNQERDCGRVGTALSPPPQLQLPSKYCFQHDGYEDDEDEDDAENDADDGGEEEDDDDEDGKLAFKWKNV
jgi:hypothetical protein